MIICRLSRSRGGLGVSHWLPHWSFAQGSRQSYLDCLPFSPNPHYSCPHTNYSISLSSRCEDSEQNNKFISEVDSELQTSSNFKENVIKIVDKSYLEKSFVAGKHADQIDETVLKFGLNKEQERAF
jgi:hypothetical protein